MKIFVEKNRTTISPETENEKENLRRCIEDGKANLTNEEYIPEFHINLKEASLKIYWTNEVSNEKVNLLLWAIFKGIPITFQSTEKREDITNEKEKR